MLCTSIEYDDSRDGVLFFRDLISPLYRHLMMFSKRLAATSPYGVVPPLSPDHAAGCARVAVKEESVLPVSLTSSFFEDLLAVGNVCMVNSVASLIHWVVVAVRFVVTGTGKVCCCRCCKVLRSRSIILSKMQVPVLRGSQCPW